MPDVRAQIAMAQTRFGKPKDIYGTTTIYIEASNSGYTKPVFAVS